MPVFAYEHHPVSSYQDSLAALFRSVVVPEANNEASKGY
jgi:hypothetical protein